ncbi:HtaA domain-containing protein [Streptomyces sp. NPDC015242]|uniref:HtaA domain-containing protein n=1 Tax=Streptomyces sp. NPDC015242 TaxID=3364951 RepID=UPI0036F5B848
MPVRRRRTAALAAAVATAAALGATALAPSSAAAAEVPLTGYALTWGIKQSYRTYVTGMAAGTFTTADGASQAAGNGPFTFVDGSGGYDPTAHTVDLAFQGTLRIDSKLHGFALTLSDVRFDSAAAEVTADVTRNGATTDDVPLAKVTVTRAMKDMATTLTKEAADVFGSAGYEGAAGDPLTVVQKTPPPSPSPTTPTPTATPTPTPTATPSQTPVTSPSPTPPRVTQSPAPSGPTTGGPSAPAPRGEIADGRLGWGVKESFRAYVVGPVAHGRITVSGGATQASGNGPFTFPGATGRYDTAAGTLSVSFQGSVTFQGHESDGRHGLDLTLAGLTVTLDDGAGRLTADVASLGEQSRDVVLAELRTGVSTLIPEGDVITLDDVTATLTEAGAKAFGDFYTAGTRLDPADLSIALTDDAQLPGGTDGGDGSAGASGGSTGGSADGTGSSAGGSTTVGGSTTGGSATGAVTGGLASTGSALPAGPLGAAAAAAVVMGAGAVLAVRRRRTRA